MVFILLILVSWLSFCGVYIKQTARYILAQLEFLSIFDQVVFWKNLMLYIMYIISCLEIICDLLAIGQPNLMCSCALSDGYLLKLLSSSHQNESVQK